MQLMEMAEARREGLKINDKEKKIFEELGRDDFQRTIWALPDEQQRRQILRVHPDFSEEQIVRMLEYIGEIKSEDQLTLLQDDLYSKGKGGQLTMMTLAPNFELALYIAQITGAFIFTDSPTRWEEIIQAQHKDGGMVIYNWGELTDCINSLEYPLNVNPLVTFKLRETGKLGKIRKVLRDIYSAIQSKESIAGIQALTDRLKPELVKAHEAAQREMKAPKGDGGGGMEDIEEHTFNARLKCVIPAGGITHNNVQRMLLSCGLSNYLKNVPMAIFFDHD